MIDTINITASAPAYKGTVFLSYSRADDEKPPFETAQGWVEFFWGNLRWALTDQGLPQAKLWLDRYDIEPAEDFTDRIEKALEEARMIITILSPNWVKRPWCLKEIERFVELHSADDIVLVKKLEPLEADIPVPLRNRVGYKFFVEDMRGQVRPFYYLGLQDRDAYLGVIRQITLWIAGRLTNVPTPKELENVGTGPVVYLAAAADELRDARQRIANDLAGAGYVVCPSGGLPDTAPLAEAAVREALAKAVLSVHLVGESEGARPDGSNEGIVRLQLRIARAFSGASGPVPRVLWAPKWLPGNRDKKRDPFEVLKEFGELLPGEEVYAEEVTDLSQLLRARLTPPVAPASAVLRLLVAGAAAEDDGLVGMLANRLQSSDIKVKPRFSDDAEPLGNLDQATAVLLLWDKASRASIDLLLDALLAHHARVTVLYLAGGDAASKQRFFREGVYVEQLAEIPADRKSARELLVRLEIVPPGSGSNARSSS